MVANQKVGDMTLDELKDVIREVVQEDKPIKPWYIQKPDRPIEELLDEIFANIWTPPPGSKSSLEYLREDRDR
jgi:polyhydroxyalkanoate synthesis regulator phasin